MKFHSLFFDEREDQYINDCITNKILGSDGKYSKSCQEQLKVILNSRYVHLTPSCTDALEISALLANIKVGDEVILPSYAFSSCANAFVLRGATPVFVDIEADNMCLDVDKAISAITPKTKAICTIHYAGFSSDIEKLALECKKRNIFLIEDAAQALGSTYNNKPLGSFGDVSCFSFHYTKNLGCGEGGSLAINRDELIQRSFFLRDKGTNRTEFINGKVDKYTWVDVGSSFVMSELNAAVLAAQLEKYKSINQKRLEIWNAYHEQLQTLEQQGFIKRPNPNSMGSHNAHMYYIHIIDSKLRSQLIDKLHQKHIPASSHFEPLHLSPFGKSICRIYGDLKTTETLSKSILRLPLHYEMEDQVTNIIDTISEFYNHKIKAA